jgi:alpha-ketoglutarate-dependent taurine dioxygenase
MSTERTGVAARFQPRERRAVRVSRESLVTMRPLLEKSSLPLLIEPATERLDLVEWAQDSGELIATLLDKHGGILFRNCSVRTCEQFERFMTAACGPPLPYSERSSPRSQVSGNIYTSTNYPPEYPIYLHNEQSYNLVFPLRIAFYCVTPAESGGETPIADSRRVSGRIRPDIRDRFAERGYMYVRNFGEGFGLTWQEAFQTTSSTEVEAYCRQNDIVCEWKDGQQRLRTRQVRRVLARHPRTGERTWFNHMVFFHLSTLPADVRATMLQMFAEHDVANNTYYGDGSPIEPEILDHLREAYEAETVRFAWQPGDVLLLDNMLAAHGRNPFRGTRKVVTAMAMPTRWADC